MASHSLNAHATGGEITMTSLATAPGRNDDEAVEAVRAGDQAAFAALAERHRRELQVHCYRMLGSLEDAEDQVQETFLRAWRNRAGFQGRAPFRAWLYRIATNACLDALARAPRRAPAAPADGRPPMEVPWLGPYPDRLLEGAAPSDEGPEASRWPARRSSLPTWWRSSTCRRGRARC
jgi:RNA polymerase sigma-70 factor (ECF subfamily)